MHKENKRHLQPELFCDFPETTNELLQAIKDSEEYYFYENVFCQIDESIFAQLYCKDNGRPNAPINVMIGALLLKEKRNWSYREMFSELKYNVAVRAALGLTSLFTLPFSESTIFNFLNLLHRNSKETGINLFDKAFEKITLSQLKRYKIKTDIARIDSFMLDSNIRKYNRLMLLIEVLKRLHRVLKNYGDKRFDKYLSPYIELTSERYIYDLKSSDVPREIEKIASVYLKLKDNLSSERYGKTREYKNFIRVFDEHFVVIEEKIEIRTQSELGSGILQSPDDEDATYRTKRKKSYRGQSGLIVETANPVNEINLITDVSCVSNNVDDSVALNERLDEIKRKTEDLQELHQDGGFGSVDNDNKMKELNIKPIQTAIKGRKGEMKFEIEKVSEDSYTVSCPNGRNVESSSARKRFKAIFEKSSCDGCPYYDKCPTNILKNGNRVFYFKDEDFIKRKRHASLSSIPSERRNLRANVESTVHEFTYNLQGHKLKVRRRFGAELYLFSMAIMINFGRIYRYLTKKAKDENFLLFFAEKYLDYYQIYHYMTYIWSIKYKFERIITQLRFS